MLKPSSVAKNNKDGDVVKQAGGRVIGGVPSAFFVREASFDFPCVLIRMRQVMAREASVSLFHEQTTYISLFHLRGHSSLDRE